MRRTTGSRRFVRLLGVATIAVAALALNACDPPLTPTADYQFNGTKAACGGDAPALTALGTGSFATESVDGKSWKVQRFNDDSGVKLSPTTNEVGSNGVYTVVVLFRTTGTSGYNRIADFKNGTADTGLYVYNGTLKFYNQAAGTSTPIGTTFVQVAMTRASNGAVNGYVDGAKQFTFTDSANDGVITNNTLRFFQDNTSGSATTEASPGAVARIRVYNKALTASEVSGLDQLPANPCSTT
jgi:Concanavalin A-like lectin/glucanases superfamily